METVKRSVIARSWERERGIDRAQRMFRAMDFFFGYVSLYIDLNTQNVGH